MGLIQTSLLLNIFKILQYNTQFVFYIALVVKAFDPIKP